ncbi:ROK family transcriptional regulator [Natronosporangium hydrolyticum]|uniref:ROK family transcriptional regulator n=1 Tax=Natronosporangium hydrolyticum TaxID=2811111 RepID=A0A895YKX8_9ACTN|nr:ROK family transcriptional regulator [Natronosporangium hydrolyticum]QSB15953.1 ROK family transcriptional regulator [Natronosporangium hydrolyticum]
MRGTRQPGTPRLLRALNDRAALELLMTHGPLTRTKLGELTGLSKVTASQLVERLEERGLVVRVGEVAGSRGPNAALYAVDPTAAYVVGVEVSSESDKVTAACADITGAVVGRVEESIRGDDQAVGVVHRAVVRALEQGQAQLSGVRRVVIGTPGLVDPASGDIAYVYNLPRWHRGLLSALREDLRAPVAFENDVNLAAVAEARLGAAREARDFILIWVDVGIGLAVMLDGRLHRGATGAAGEIGFMPVPGAPVVRDPGRRWSPPHSAPDAGTPPAGLDGGFHQLAGLAAVREVARSHGFAGAGADGVRAAVAAGTAGSAVLDELARRLALGVACISVVIDPPLVVIAGEVGRAGGMALAERVQHEVAAITVVSPRVVPTEVGAEPVLTGALHTALAAARDEVFGATS